MKTKNDALSQQVDGSHYKGCKLQPMELAYKLGESPAFLKVAKYLIRDKGDKIINLKKAIHIAQIDEQLNGAKVYKASKPKIKATELLKLLSDFSKDVRVQDVLFAMYFYHYEVVIRDVEQIIKDSSQA